MDADDAMAAICIPLTCGSASFVVDGVAHLPDEFLALIRDKRVSRINFINAANARAIHHISALLESTDILAFYVDSDGGHILVDRDEENDDLQE